MTDKKITPRHEILKIMREEMTGPDGFEQLIARFPEVLEAPKVGENFLTTLSQACEHDMVEKFIPLISPKIKTKTKNTALIFAAGSYKRDTSRIKTLQLLLPVSDPLVQNSHGLNAFLTAAKSGAIESMKLLYSPKANKAVDLMERNALMIAAYHGNTECVQWLMQYSDPEQTDSYGLTAAGIAEYEEREALAQLLKAWEKGAMEKKLFEAEIPEMKNVKKMHL